MEVCKIRNRGEVMVEAAIYFPIVLILAMFVIFASLMKAQKCLASYQLDAITDEAAQCMSMDGYYLFRGVGDNTLDIGLSAYPDEELVQEYYDRKLQSSSLYRSWQDSSLDGIYDTQEKLTDFVNEYSLISSIVQPVVLVEEDNSLTDRIHVDLAYSFQLPNFMKSLLGNQRITLVTLGNTGLGTNPADYIRSMDMASNDRYLLSIGSAYWKLRDAVRSFRQTLQ